MKRITILFFAIMTAMSAFCQTYIQDGDRCFDSGDYACAVTNYDNAFKNASGKDKQIAEIKLTRAKWCTDHIKIANQAFANKNYKVAKENYQNVLETNPNDSYAKAQLDKCILNLTPVSTTLNLSKNSLSFTTLGGNETISVTTNSSTYKIDLLPSWCTVQKYSSYFVVTCNSNSLITARNDYFTVTAGEKTIRVIVNQAAKVETSTKTTSTKTLSVSQDYIYFDTNGGKSESIKVFSNTENYSVSLIPSWCSVQTYKGYFIVTCNSNYNSQKRSDWFYVTASDKQVKVYINQNGSIAINKSDKIKKSKPTNLYLGFGALKPLIFKSDGQTLSNMDFGYSFTIGLVKTLGIYAKINTNFSTISGDYSPSTFPVIYYGVPDPYSNSSFDRFGVVGGLMLKINPITIYVGAGEGHYYHFVNTKLYKYLDDSFVKTINLTTMSFSGLETDAGMFINFGNVGLSLGVSSFSFKYYEVNAGLGIQL